MECLRECWLNYIVYLRICWCCFPMLPHLPWTLLFLSLGGQCSERLVDVCTSPRVCFSCFDCVSLTFVSPLFKAVGWGGRGGERNLGALCGCVSVCLCVFWWRFLTGRLIHMAHVMQTTASQSPRWPGSSSQGELQVHAQVQLWCRARFSHRGYHARSGL